MKRSIMMFVAAMVIFSGLNGTVFGQGLQGERFFDITQITAPKGLPMALAKGIGDDGKVAMLSFLFPDRAQLLIGNEKKMMSIADYGVESFFNPVIMTNSGAIVGYQEEGWDSFPSVMFVSDGQKKAIRLTEYGRIIDAKSNLGKVYVLVSRNDELVLCSATASGVEPEMIVAERSYYTFYEEGGIAINGQLDVMYLIAPTSFSFGDTYFSFISIFEIDLEKRAVNNNYIFGWDEESQYLATVNFGGVDGVNLVGQYDDMPFVYDLSTRNLQTYVVGQDSESTQAKGIFSGEWLVGEYNSSSLFFQNMGVDATMATIVDFPFEYMTVITVKGNKIVVKTGDNRFYAVTPLKNTVVARH